MTMLRTAVLLIAMLTVTSSIGCAQAYHAYDSCYVDCKYCVPGPLPYAHYQGCVCHSCAAAKHAQPRPSDVGDAAATP